MGQLTTSEQRVFIVEQQYYSSNKSPTKVTVSEVVIKWRTNGTI